MLLAALHKMPSTAAKASFMVILSFKPSSPSFSIIIIESTSFSRAAKPTLAFRVRSSPSQPKGTVTMPMVRMPWLRHILATSGAAPVPVPPPMPAVINTILVLPSIMARISSSLSMAASLPRSGTAPAPKPSDAVKPS